jgi:hypothetical protein
MVMRNAAILLIAMGLGVPAAHAEETTAPAAKPPPLVGMKCLTPNQSSGWTYLDDSHILIDGGPRKYRVEFTEACWDLKFELSLAFKGDRFSGRVCGDIGDEVITENQHCRIKSMEIISTEQYRQTIRDNKAAIEARKLERANKKSGSP